MQCIAHECFVPHFVLNGRLFAFFFRVVGVSECAIANNRDKQSVATFNPSFQLPRFSLFFSLQSFFFKKNTLEDLLNTVIDSQRTRSNMPKPDEPVKKDHHSTDKLGYRAHGHKSLFLCSS